MPRTLLFMLSCYRTLLWLYPTELRTAYGGEMESVFEQQLRAEWTSRGMSGAASVVWDTLRELFTIAIPGQLSSQVMVASYLSLAITSAVLFFLVAMLQDRALAKWVSHNLLFGG